MTERVRGIAQDVEALNELRQTVARLDERMSGVETNVKATRETIGKVRDAIEERDKAATDERKATRTALLGLTGVIVAALISGVAAIVVAGLGGS